MYYNGHEGQIKDCQRAIKYNAIKEGLIYNSRKKDQL